MAGNLTLSTISDGTNSTSVTNAIRGSAKAWVSFNGGYSNTAGVINSSYNVSSVTANGTGDYTVNFTNAMSDTNYVVFGGCREDLQSISYTSNRVVAPRRDTSSMTTTLTRIGVTDFGYSAQNVDRVFVSIYR